MESENPSALKILAFDTGLTEAEFPDSFKNCLEENHVKIESEPVNANDKCSSPKLLRSQKRKKGCGKDISNKYIVSMEEEEPQKRRRKKRVLTQKQREIYNASTRVEALTYEQIEHRRARQRLCHQKLTPEQHQQKLLSRRKSALTPEQIKRRNLQNKQSYWRKKKRIEELRKLEEKSGRIEALAENPSGENCVKVECSSPDLPACRKSEQSSVEDTLNKCNVSTDEQEQLQPRLKKRVLTQKQRERYNASARVKALSEEQKEYRKARRRMHYIKNTPTPEQLERKRWYWCKIKKIEEQRKLEENSQRIKEFDENPFGEFAFDNQLTNADTSNKCIVSTDEQEPRRPRHKKRVVTQEQKERYKAMSRVEGLSDEQLQHKRAYAREKYKRRRRQIQEQRKLEEKSGRIEALAKIRQEIKALEEQLKHTADRYERNKLRRKINIRNKKEKLLETAIDSNLEQLPPLHQKRLPLTPEQRERRRLYDIEYRLKRKQKKMDNALNKPLENESEAK